MASLSDNVLCCFHNTLEGFCDLGFGTAAVPGYHAICSNVLCGTFVKVDKQLLGEFGTPLGFTEKKGILEPHPPLLVTQEPEAGNSLHSFSVDVDRTVCSSW